MHAKFIRPNATKEKPILTESQYCSRMGISRQGIYEVLVPRLGDFKSGSVRQCVMGVGCVCVHACVWGDENI